MTGRNIIEVIDKLLLVVPKEEQKIHRSLKETRLSALYSSPESMRRRWIQLSLCFLGCPNPPETDWQKEAARIIKGETNGEADSKESSSHSKPTEENSKDSTVQDHSDSGGSEEGDC